MGTKTTLVAEKKSPEAKKLNVHKDAIKKILGTPKGGICIMIVGDRNGGVNIIAEGETMEVVQTMDATKELYIKRETGRILSRIVDRAIGSIQGKGKSKVKGKKKTK